METVECAKKLIHNLLIYDEHGFFFLQRTVYFNIKWEKSKRHFHFFFILFFFATAKSTTVTHDNLFRIFNWKNEFVGLVLVATKEECLWKLKQERKLKRTILVSKFVVKVETFFQDEYQFLNEHLRNFLNKFVSKNWKIYSTYKIFRMKKSEINELQLWKSYSSKTFFFNTKGKLFTNINYFLIVLDEGFG